VPSAIRTGDDVPIEVVAGNLGVHSNVVTISVAQPVGF